MATLSARATDDSLAKVAGDPACARGLQWIDKSAAWVTDQQIRLTEIPAPEFDEARRGEALKELFAASGFQVRTDKTGNVIAERPGSNTKKFA
jgi:tripeptide aminopeptidase